MNTYSENVKEFGLFTFVNMEIKRKRASMPQASQWYAPVPQSKEKPKSKVVREKVEETPVKPLANLATADNVDEKDEQLEELLKSDVEEVYAAAKSVEAGVEEIEPDDVGEEQEVEVSDE